MDIQNAYVKSGGNMNNLLKLPLHVGGDTDLMIGVQYLKKCSRLVHYTCTQLPTYQLSQFLTKGCRRYVCMQCTHVPDYVSDIRAKYVKLHSDY